MDKLHCIICDRCHIVIKDRYSSSPRRYIEVIGKKRNQHYCGQECYQAIKKFGGKTKSQRNPLFPIYVAILRFLRKIGLMRGK